MARERELRKYQDPEEARRRLSHNLVVGWMLALALFFMMAVAGSTLMAKPYVDNGGVDISASQRHFDTPFALMYRAPKNLPVESWGPAF
jgi:hypothetical protein